MYSHINKELGVILLNFTGKCHYSKFVVSPLQMGALKTLEF